MVLPTIDKSRLHLGQVGNHVNPQMAAVLILGLLVRLAIAWAPVEWLLHYVLADDSFYYFTIARNFAHGNGFSFDSLAETNGFHPLWMVPLTLIYSLVEDRFIAIHVALTVSAFLDVAAVVVLLKMLGEMGTRKFPQMLAIGLYLLAPVLLSHAGPMNGMETALNVFIILVYLRQYWRMIARNQFTGSGPCVLGAIAGLLLLVRTDNIILVLVTWLFMPLLSRSTTKGALLSLPRVFVPTLIVVVPWVLWSLLRFGTLIQVSGVSVPFMIRTELTSQGWSSTDYFIQFIKNLANTLTFFPIHFFETRILSLPVLMVATAILILSVALIRRDRGRGVFPRTTVARFCLVLLVSVLLFVFAHTLRAVYMRGWYYMSLYPILLLCGATGLQSVIERMPRKAIGWFTALFLAVAYGVSLPQLLGPRQGEMDKFRMVQVMNAVLPSGARVGSGNAGVYGYFFQQGITVNLDGLVNNHAYESIRERDLEGYCRRVGITHLVDPAAGFERMAKYWNPEQTSPLGFMKIIHREPGRTPTDTLVLGKFISSKLP